MKQIAGKRLLTLVLAITMLFCMIGSSASATIAPAGDQNYLSMHNYMSLTDIPGVYKVTLSLQSPAVDTTKLPVYVAITLDRSGSMFDLNGTDIWDSTSLYTGTSAPGRITRAKAIEVAVAATIDELIADGNEQIYLNISTHDGNSVSGGNAGAPQFPSGMPSALNSIADSSQFVSLYDNGILRPEFDKNDPANWIMLDWHVDGGSRGWRGFGDSNDFALAFSRLHGLYRDGIVNASIPMESVRYVLAMGDGDDWGAELRPEPWRGTVARSSMEWATALKAPLDANYKSPGGSVTEAKTVMGAAGGMGAVIWGVTMGRDTASLPAWDTDILRTVAGVPDWSNIWSWGWYQKAQPRMVANTMSIPEAKIADGSIYYPSSSPKVWSNPIIDDYVRWWNTAGMTVDNGSKGNAHYTHSEFLVAADPALYYGTSLVEAFANFGDAAAKAAKSVHTGLKGNMALSSMYDLYAYPGKPMVELTSTDPATVQSYELSGTRNLKWNIDQIESGNYLTMTFYVKMDESAKEGLYYALFDSASFTYIPNEQTERVTKLFPIPYATVGGSVKDGGSASDVAGSAATGTNTSSTGAAGHQENRDLAKDPVSGWGSASNTAPDVTGVKSGMDSSGRSKVQVDLTNGALMRYQWQFKNAAGEWEDIFGATGSHYTLGKQFAAGQEYELRAKITNPAGSTSFSDSVKLTVEGKVSAGLQAKENAPNIEGDQVMDGLEEIAVADTATNGQLLTVITALAILAVASTLIVAARRRR